VTEAILLVGGKGTRLRPLTVRTPKPMVPAAGVPFLAHQLARARAAGVDHVVMATSYLAEVFEPYFGDGSQLGLHLEYVTEEEPLGTGGAIRNVASRLRSAPSDPVLVFNGDILTGLDIRGLVDTHVRTGADVSLHLTRVDDPRAYGLVPTDGDGRVTAFLEKPQTPEEIVTDQINAGAYVFDRSVIDTIPGGRPVSVERETFPGLLTDGAHLQ
jgi:mannose-1-phosphate guanylyltransferase